MPRRSVKKGDKLSIQINKNACDQSESKSNITSRIELIGNLIISKLKGSERDDLKEKLFNSSFPNSKIPISNVPVSSSRRSLKQLLTDLHTFDYHTEREYRTIGVGDNDVNVSSKIENEEKKILKPITRTICTRSSKLNNSEQIDRVLPNRARQRRSTLRNNIIHKQNQIDDDQSTEKHLDI